MFLCTFFKNSNLKNINLKLLNNSVVLRPFVICAQIYLKRLTKLISEKLTEKNSKSTSDF